MSDVFSFKGFIGRASYWRFTGICSLAFITAYFSIILSINGSDVLAIALVGVGVSLFFAAWVALLGIGVRRLHGRGKHGFWIGLYYPVPFILAIAAMDPNGQRDFLDWIALAILAWAIIDLGILGGRPAPIAA